MPLYEYRCPHCDDTFETLVTSRTAVEVACPKCDRAGAERLIGLPASPSMNDRAAATNCRGDGPPCGATLCGRKR